MKVYLNAVSNAPLRVRIALAVKRIRAEELHIDLYRGYGDQHDPAFASLNPQRLVPVLVDGTTVVRQSLAIIEYLEECQPEPALLPRDPAGRARVRSLAMIVACDGQPLLNRRVRDFLATHADPGSELARRWFDHWMKLSLFEYESCLVSDGRSAGFSHGASPTLADVCLVPHVLMAHRFAVDTSRYPVLSAIFANCMAVPEFANAVDAFAGAARAPEDLLPSA